MSRNEQPAPREYPNSIEAEQAILGAIFMNNQAYAAVSEFLRPEHFYEPLHRQMFDAISGLILAGKPATTVTVKTFINMEKKVGELTMSQYMASLVSGAVSIINAKDYAQVIYELSLRRDLIEIGTEMVNAAYDAAYDETPEKQIELSSDKLYKISEATRAVSGAGSFRGSAITSAYLNFIGRDAGNKAVKTGVHIGIHEVATVLSERSLEAKNLYGMLSSSGEGKTSMMLQIAMDALLAGNPVCIFSYDQTGEQLTAQMIQQQTGIEMRIQKSGSMNEGQFQKALEWASRLAQLPFEVIECSSDRDDPTRLAMKAKQFVKTHGNGKTPLFIGDHMGAIPCLYRDRKSDEGTKARNTGHAIKDGMKAVGGTGLILQQRAGAGMKRLNPRPVPMDLFGGETARQPFDSIFYLFRPEEHKRRQLEIAATDREKEQIEERFLKMVPANLQGENTAEIGTLKVRFGRVGIKRYMQFIPEQTRYEPFAHLADYNQPEMFGGDF